MTVADQGKSLHCESENLEIDVALIAKVIRSLLSVHGSNLGSSQIQLFRLPLSQLALTMRRFVFLCLP